MRSQKSAAEVGVTALALSQSRVSRCFRAFFGAERAVQVNVAIKRAFVRLRRLTMGYDELARKIASMERNYDARFKVVFDAIRELMTPEPSSKRRIGFRSDDA